MAIDFEAEGLLEGLEDKAREDRLELLRELEADGVSADELRAAIEEDRLALVPVERLLAGTGQRYTSAEVAEQAGIDVELLRRQRGALGLPIPSDEVKAFGEADLEAAKRLKLALDAGLPEDGMVEAGRVIGLAMSQVAVTVNSLIGEAFLSAGDTELQAAGRYVAEAEALRPMLSETLDYALTLHITEALRHVAVGRAELASGRLPNSQEITVCFADLVGFTRLGEELPPEELGRVTGRLASLAREVATSPVRLVKMIGDAAMLISNEAEPAAAGALDLIDAAEAEGEGFPVLRAGLASGSAISRGGDWYGRPVNLASRITAVARPGSVLVDETTREALPDSFAFSFAGERRLKGIEGGVKLFRLRRGEKHRD